MFKNAENKIIEAPKGESYKLLNPGPIVVIQTKNQNGTNNVGTFAWVKNLDFKPHLITAVINADSKTCENLINNRECIIYIPTFEVLEKVIEAGSFSGKEKSKSYLCENDNWFNGAIAKLTAKIHDDSNVSKYDLFILEITKAEVVKNSINDDFTYNLQSVSLISHLGEDMFLELK